MCDCVSTLSPPSYINFPFLRPTPPHQHTDPSRCCGFIGLVPCEHVPCRLSRSEVLRSHNEMLKKCMNSNKFYTVYRVAQKLAHFLYALTLPNIDRFSKFFHCQNQEKICNSTITKDPITPQLCRYTTLCPTKAKHLVAAFFLQGKDVLFKTFYLLVHLM